MTRWRPDTCICEVEYSDPDITVVKVHRKCGKHAGTPDDATHLATMLAHNRKKNYVKNALSDHLGTPQGLVVSYDAADDLHVVGHGLTADQQPAALDKVRTFLGSSALHFD